MGRFSAGVPSPDSQNMPLFQGILVLRIAATGQYLCGPGHISFLPLEMEYIQQLDIIMDFLQDGAPKIAKLPYKWLYGRYNYS